MDGLAKEALGGLDVAFGTEIKVNGLASLVNGAVQVDPLALDPLR